MTQIQSVIAKLDELKGKLQYHLLEVFKGQLMNKPDYNSEWAEAIENRFHEITTLPHGWDGYSGEPVSKQCAHFAKSMLEQLWVDGVPPPSIVPGSDGSLQVEWHRNGYDVELDVLGEDNVVATLNCRDYESQEIELEIQNNFSQILGWMNLIADKNC